ncbi:MAG: hypothetical protein QS99_C0015G0047, partial [archaeon GW2011_AR4]
MCYHVLTRQFSVLWGDSMYKLTFQKRVWVVKQF